MRPLGLKTKLKKGKAMKAQLGVLDLDGFEI